MEKIFCIYIFFYYTRRLYNILKIKQAEHLCGSVTYKHIKQYGMQYIEFVKQINANENKKKFRLIVNSIANYNKEILLIILSKFLI